MQRRHKLMLLALALPIAIAAQNASKSDPFVGTWKLDTAKSHYSGEPAPTSETVTIQPGGAANIREVGADGKTVNWSYTATEGQTVPITGMDNSSVMEKRVSDRVVEHTWSMNGDNLRGRGVVSKDGKTMRYTLDGTSKEGKKIHNLLILNKE